MTEEEIDKLIFSNIEEDNRTKTGGKGKKLCPDCNLYSGARVKFCYCGTEFKKKTKEAKVREDKKKRVSTEIGQDYLDLHKYIVALNLKSDFRMVFTPSGTPYVNLNKTDKNEVHDWCYGMVNAASKDFAILTPDSLKYYLRYFSFSKEENEHIEKFIDEWKYEVEVS